MAVMDEKTTRDFLRRLWVLQGKAALTNAALATRLGCDASYITHLRSGRRAKRQLGLRFVLNAAREFTELRSFLLPAELLVSNNAVPAVNGDVA